MNTNTRTEKERKGCQFFSNRNCEYFPCHEGMKEVDFNCLFCYCPLYYTVCLGNPQRIDVNGVLVKDCSLCTFPHQPDSYQKIIEYLTLMAGKVSFMSKEVIVGTGEGYEKSLDGRR